MLEEMGGEGVVGLLAQLTRRRGPRLPREGPMGVEPSLHVDYRYSPAR